MLVQYNKHTVYKFGVPVLLSQSNTATGISLFILIYHSKFLHYKLARRSEHISSFIRIGVLNADSHLATHLFGNFQFVVTDEAHQTLVTSLKTGNVETLQNMHDLLNTR
jgi:hypothetical protein